RTFSAFHTTTRSKGSSLVLPYNSLLDGKKPSFPQAINWLIYL
ncbi:MAG: hypothetical protein ACI9YH_001617, partial [Colwellia sp.]